MPRKRREKQWKLELHTAFRYKLRDLHDTKVAILPAGAARLTMVNQGPNMSCILDGFNQRVTDAARKGIQTITLQIAHDVEFEEQEALCQSLEKCGYKLTYKINRGYNTLEVEW